MSPLFSAFTFLLLQIAAQKEPSNVATAPAADLLNQPRLAFHIAPPISNAELSRIGDLLGLSEAQKLFVAEALYPRYMQRAKRLHDERMPEVLQLAIDGAKEVHSKTDHYPALIKAFFTKKRDLSDSLLAVEQQFFDECIALLAEPQVEKLLRVRQRRQRAHCDRSQFMIRGAKIDAVELVEQIVTDSQDFLAIEEQLREFESELTPLLVKADELSDSDSIKRAEYDFRVTILGSDPNVTGAQLDELLNARGKIGSQCARLQARVHEINEKHLDLISAELSDELGDVIIGRYKSIVYAERVYPDELNPQALYNLVIASDVCSDEHRQALQAVKVEYQKRYDAVCKQMERVYNEWRLDYASHLLAREEPRQEYEEEMRKLRLQRWQLNRTFVDQIAGIIPSHANLALQAKIESFRSRYEKLVAMAKHDTYPGM